MLMRRAQDAPGYRLTVDLQAQTVDDGQEFEAHFDIDPFRRERLLQGLDDIGLTLQHADSIAAFEAARSA